MPPRSRTATASPRRRWRRCCLAKTATSPGSAPCLWEGKCYLGWAPHRPQAPASAKCTRDTVSRTRPRVFSIWAGRSSQTMRCFLLAVFAACATQAFVLPSRPAAVVTRCSAVSVPAVSMTSLDKKKKAANNKAKSARAVTKRFKATATGKLLRRRPFRQHILTKKHPLRKQKLRKCAAHPCPTHPPRPQRRPSPTLHMLASRPQTARHAHAHVPHLILTLALTLAAASQATLNLAVPALAAATHPSAAHVQNAVPSPTAPPPPTSDALPLSHAALLGTLAGRARWTRASSPPCRS